MEAAPWKHTFIQQYVSEEDYSLINSIALKRSEVHMLYYFIVKHHIHLFNNVYKYRYMAYTCT